SARAATSPLSLHDALPILVWPSLKVRSASRIMVFSSNHVGFSVEQSVDSADRYVADRGHQFAGFLAHPQTQVRQVQRRYVDVLRSEEHTSELQSRETLVCR